MFTLIKILVYVLALFALAYLPIFWAADARLRRQIGPRSIVLTSLGITVMFISPSAIVCVAVIVILFLGFPRSRINAVCDYVMMVALLPFAHFYISAGPIYFTSFGMTEVLSFALLLVLLFKNGSRDRMRAVWTAEDSVILTLFIILWIGVGRFPSTSIVLRNGATQLLILVMPYWLIRKSVKSTGELSQVVAALAVSSVVLSVWAIYEAHAGWSLFDAASRRYADVGGMAKNTLRRGDALRASATMATPLNLSCYLSIGLMALACSRSFFRVRSAYYVLVGIVILGILSTQSRGNLICVVAGAMMLCVAWRKWSWLALSGGAAAFGTVVLFSVASSLPRVAAFLNLNSDPTADVYDYRQLLLQRGMEEGMRHFWIGTDLNAVVERLSDIQQGDHIVDLVNEYLVIFLTSGVVGFTLFVFLLTTALGSLLLKFSKRLDPSIAAVRAFCAAAMITTAIELAFMSFIDRIPYMLGLVLAGTRLVKVSWYSRGPSRSGVRADHAINLVPGSSQVVTHARSKSARTLK